MGRILSIHKNKEKAANYWIESYQYNKQVIDNIEDPSVPNIQKVLTAIPSPFARMHLFDTAFKIATRELKKKNDDNEKDATLYDKMISECFDLLELLFEKNSLIKKKPNLNIIPWNPKNEIDKLYKSNETSHQHLGSVLEKYIITNQEIEKFNTFYLFELDNEIIGGTSPYSIVYTKPDLNVKSNTNLKKVNGKVFFQDYDPLKDRDLRFIQYLYSFFKENPELQKYAENIYNYLQEYKKFLGNSISNIINEEFTGVDPLTLDDGKEITIFNKTLLIHIGDDIIQIISPLKIKSSKLPDELKEKEIVPLVLKDGYNIKNESDNNFKIPFEVKESLIKRTIPGTYKRHPYIVVNDFLSDTLIKVNYKINSDYFVTLRDENSNISHDYLLPIKPLYFDFFTSKDLQNNIRFKVISKNSVRVYLDIPVEGGKVTFHKEYLVDATDENKTKNNCGEIVNLDVYFAFFPLFKVTNDSDFNDYYKVLMVDTEIDKELELIFYNDDNKSYEPNTNTNKKIKKTIRNDKKNSNSSIGSYYYEANFPFQYIQLTVKPDKYTNEKYESIIVPKYKEIRKLNGTYNIAVDFGTTNSHIALLEENDNKEPESLSISDKDLQVILFPEIKKNQSGKTLTEIYEDISGDVNNKLITTQINEFIPSIINSGDNPKYYFPVRTALSSIKEFNPAQIDVLGNINISFTFGKLRISDEQNIFSNLKWQVNKDENDKKIEAFLSELLLLARNKILLNGGDPKQSKIIWFKPLSMYAGYQNKYNAIWSNIVKKYFHSLSDDNIVVITESSAPYFYYKKTGKTSSTTPILSVDIGGGSTDIAFFIDNEPKFGSSFNFAGNSIWAPNSVLGYAHDSLAEPEGIYKIGLSLIENLKTKHSDNDFFKNIYHDKKNYDKKALHPNELFNTLFSWDEQLKITQELSNNSYIKFLILFHFSAIMYYSLVLLKLKLSNEKDNNKIIPENIIVSGNGSKYLKILDPNDKYPMIASYVKELIKNIFEIDTNNLKIIKTVKEKEATCMGGLYELSNGKIKDINETVLYYGNNEDSFKMLKKYKDINDKLKEEITQSVEKFIDIFFDINLNLDFKKNFLLDFPEPIEDYRNDFKKDINKYLTIAIDERKENFSPEDEIEDALFFYPLNYIIKEISKKFFEQNEDVI